MRGRLRQQLYKMLPFIITIGCTWSYNKRYKLSESTFVLLSANGRMSPNSHPLVECNFFTYMNNQWTISSLRKTAYTDTIARNFTGLNFRENPISPLEKRMKEVPRERVGHCLPVWNSDTVPSSDQARLVHKNACEKISTSLKVHVFKFLQFSFCDSYFCVLVVGCKNREHLDLVKIFCYTVWSVLILAVKVYCLVVSCNNWKTNHKFNYKTCGKGMQCQHLYIKDYSDL